jgi:hypothetical protein
MVMATTYGTLFVELALATLVFHKPFRKWVLLAGLGLHGYIEYSMNIPLFAFVICAGYITFYSGEETKDWFLRLGGRFRPVAIPSLPPAESQTGKGAAILAADFLGRLKPQPQAPAEAGKVLPLVPGLWPLAPAGLWPKFFRQAFNPSSRPESGGAESVQKEARP